MKALADDPQEAFPGQGRMKSEQLETARLNREVIKLKAERDILNKKPRPTSRKNRREVFLHCDAPYSRTASNTCSCSYREISRSLVLVHSRLIEQRWQA